MSKTPGTKELKNSLVDGAAIVILDIVFAQILKKVGLMNTPSLNPTMENIGKLFALSVLGDVTIDYLKENKYYPVI